MRIAVVASVASLFFTSACVVDVEDTGDGLHEHTDDLVLGHNADGKQQGLAVAGRWQIPPETLAAGEEQDTAFNNAPPYDGGVNCTPGPTPGALTLRDHLIGYFPQIESVGIYNCRVIGGTNSMSLHGVGRALDLMLPTIGGDADNTLGDPIAAFLIENAEAIGVQTVIWDSTIWRVSNNPQAREYNGVNPHRDHVHVEINLAGGAKETPWFDAPFGPSQCEPLPAATTVIDEGDGCFGLFGPAEFWRHENGVGEGGNLAWTEAFQGPNAGNFAQWSLPVEEHGRYKLEVSVDPAFGENEATRYVVTAGGAQHVVTVDQSASTGWIDLGTFELTGDGRESVTVNDNTIEPVADGTALVADALRITPIAINGCEPLLATGGVVDEEGPCFTLHGPAEFWRSESGVGFGGGLLWTNGFESQAPGNWAEWRLPVSTSGDYVIDVYLDRNHAQLPSARYNLIVDNVVHELVIDQGAEAAAASDGFVSLGVFPLAAATDVRLQVFDNVSAPVAENARRLVVDAVRVRPPVDDDGTGPTPQDPPKGTIDPGPADDDDEGTVAGTAFTPGPSVQSCSHAAGGAPASALLLLVLVALRRKRGAVVPS